MLINKFEYQYDRSITKNRKDKLNRNYLGNFVNPYEKQVISVKWEPHYPRRTLPCGTKLEMIGAGGI